jgi:chromate reductase, NAD(P)H dehydrogenase (quinone)
MSTRTARLLAFSGSARRDSWNQKLVNIAARYATDAGARVTHLHLGDLNLPIFDEDIEAQGTPANATRLKQMMFEHDGFLIACPEYNSSITPLLKNAIDWASRAAEGEKPLQAYQGKVCGLMSASPGALGGLRGLVHVRAILGNIGVLVVPDQVAVGTAHSAFLPSGDDLLDGPAKQSLLRVVQRVVDVTSKLA